jgi:pimeloyl-ACP methyl ester carboxylesterase
MVEVMARIANGDLVVVIPGILGSTLRRGSRQTWGYRQIALNLHTLTARLTADLSLPGSAFDRPEEGHDDGTQVTGVLKTLGIVPGFLTIDGYDELLFVLRARFLEDRDAIVEFPYDWRLSNEYTARRLKRTVEPLLDARRHAYPAARLVLVGHSMGGLVARYYAECLDERKLTRRVVTIGTPYQGAVKALSVLGNGYAELGPKKFHVGELARSLPSVAELLPTYDCLASASNSAPGGLAKLAAAKVPGLPNAAFRRCLRFHEQIAAAVAANGDDRPEYHALLSHRQRTDGWASIDDAGTVVAHQPADLAERGDGTVPRCSASPPEWADDASATFLAGRHSALQQQREALIQLQGILTARPRRPMAVVDEIAVDADPVTEPGAGWTVTAQSVEGADSLVLSVTVTDPEDGRTLVSTPLRPCGGGRYAATTALGEAGIFRWTVHTEPTAATPIDPVSDIVLCAHD